MKKLTFLEKFKRKCQRERDKLETKRKHLADPVYVITPSEHGNGGWCGSTTHGVYELAWILRRNPVILFHDGYYNPMFGSEIRICKTNNPNDALYTFDHEWSCEWEKC